MRQLRVNNRWRAHLGIRQAGAKRISPNLSGLLLVLRSGRCKSSPILNLFIVSGEIT